MNPAPRSPTSSRSWPRRALGIRPALVALARRIVLDGGEAEDVADECISKLARAMSRGEEIGEPEAWLRRAVLHLAIDRQRRTARHARAVPQIASKPPRRPDQLAVQREEVEWIRERVLGLPERQRDVIILRDLEGRSYDDIARVLGIRASTARAHAHAARETLRKELERWIRR